MNKIILITAAIMGLLSIIIGAFAAHGLKPHVSPENLQTLETGVRYQMYHALFLLFIGSSPLVTSGYKTIIFYLVICGVILFSGSIYLLTLGIVPSKYVWFVTPVGGLLLLASWLMIAFNM